MSRYGRYSYSYFPTSKSKGERKADAAKKQRALEKKGAKLSPVVLEGITIASTCWGKAWCKNIESYQDYENRLPRGRSYVRSNSVIDLQVSGGEVRAQVMGSSLYRVEIKIRPIARSRWTSISAACSGKIGSLVELLQGRISKEVMAVMTEPGKGLFPEPAEITFKCSCPDSAGLCKHIAASLYGIGSRLDHEPELLFMLRGADTADLLASVVGSPVSGMVVAEGEMLDSDDLSDVFNVDLEEDVPKSVVSSAKKLRGRPKKAAAPAAAEPAKKPRGRPKKVAVPAAAEPAKKPRGRPKKAAAPTATKPKR